MSEELERLVKSQRADRASKDWSMGVGPRNWLAPAAPDGIEPIRTRSGPRCEGDGRMLDELREQTQKELAEWRSSLLYSTQRATWEAEEMSTQELLRRGLYGVPRSDRERDAHVHLSRTRDTWAEFSGRYDSEPWEVPRALTEAVAAAVPHAQIELARWYLELRAFAGRTIEAARPPRPRRDDAELERYHRALSSLAELDREVVDELGQARGLAAIVVVKGAVRMLAAHLGVSALPPREWSRGEPRKARGPDQAPRARRVPAQSPARERNRERRDAQVVAHIRRHPGTSGDEVRRAIGGRSEVADAIDRLCTTGAIRKVRKGNGFQYFTDGGLSESKR